MKHLLKKIIALLLCLVMLSIVVLTSCDSGNDTPADTSDKPTESTETKGGETTNATGISLNATTLTLTVGGTSTLTATVAPFDATDKSITWLSSNTSVATVEGGIVTAVSTGTAVIIVTTANGKIAMCTITVENAKELDYVLSTDKTYYIVSGMGNCTDSEIVIPDTYNGLPVTTIGASAFYNCTELASVTIPDSITSIGSYAFNGCIKLMSITIPDSVESIGNSAFYGCTGLTNISLPFIGASLNGTSETSDKHFGYIFGASSDIPSSLKTVVITGGNSIGVSAFYNCDSIASIIIQDSVTSIGYRAFSSCDGLTSITIPDSVTSIGNEAFSGCWGLTSITIPDSVTSIGNEAFSGCRGLTSITIPDSVTSIGDGAFAYCTGLTSIKYRGTSSQWSAISKGIFWNDNTGSYTIVYNYTGE